MNGVARRPRAFVAVTGPDALDFLQRMVSNDVSGETCEALLLTPKARIVAPLRVWRRRDDDFLILTEPELGPIVRAALLRARLRADCEVELEEHTSAVVFGRADGIPNLDYGEPAVEVLDEALDATISDDELELMRIRAGTPLWARELDDRVLPAEAGLDARAISFTKGCYPGQEPVARLHYRGRANRGLRVLAIDATEPPSYDTEIVLDDKIVGRVTSAVLDDGHVLALGYVRREVPEDAALEVGGAIARGVDSAGSRP